MSVFTEEEKAKFEACNEVFEQITKDFTLDLGKEVSRKEREDKKIGHLMSNFTYGEIEFKSFLMVFKWLQKV